MSSLQARTIAECNAKKRICAIVERYIAQKKIRSDAYGFGDLLCAGSDGITLVQCAGSGEKLSHVRKINSEPQRSKAITWLKAGGHIELWVWSKRKLNRKSKALRWFADVYEVTLEFFGEK